MHPLWRATGLMVLAVALTLAACQRRPAPVVEAPAETTTTPSTTAHKYKDCNLVFVSFDALQAAHVGSLGYSRDVTPTIDAMARQGVSFHNTISVASWTVPASMTWFTGVYPSEHRMTNKFAVYQPPLRKVANLKELAPDLITLADILKENGYATGGFTGNAGVSGGFGYEQGFDVYYYEKGRFGSMDQSIPEALTWLRENKDRKFFLFLHGYDIHFQNSPATGFDYRFVDRGYNHRYTGSEQEQELLREEGLEKGRVVMSDEDVRFWRAVYDEKIQRTDAKYRKFLEELDRLGVSERTLFVLTSDHGTELYEHQRFDHGFTLYNELLHVPLILKLPGQTTSKVVPDRVSSIDVMPTLLDLLDARVSDKARKQLRGVSLVPALQGERVARDVFSETDYRQFTYKRSIITPDGWKLICTLESNTRELYNLNDDPGETRNLIEAESSRAEALQRKLYDRYKAIGHDLTLRRWDVGLNPVYASQGQ